MWLIVALVVAVVGAICYAKATPPASTQATTQPAKMSFFELLMKGRWFMIPIGFCSLLGLAIIIERLAALRSSAVIPGSFLPGLKQVFRHTQDDRAKGLAYCKESDSPISRVLAAGIARFHRGEDIVERAIEDAASVEILKLRRNLQLLFAVAAAAPMLGLLGTVWGMIEAFQGAAAGGLGKAENLATGIYEALVTTFAGLTIAIPTVIFYYYFRGKIEKIISNLNDASIDFAEHYFEDEGGGAPAPAAPVPPRKASAARKTPESPAAPAPTPAPAAPAPGPAKTGMVEFTCESCHASLRVPADRAGKKGTCPKCKSAVIVPDA